MASGEEDLFVIDYFNGKKHGFLLDIGAADGVTGSNSFRLIDEYDWSGLLIEGNKQHEKNLTKLYQNITDVQVSNDFIGHGGETVAYTCLGTRSGFTTTQKDKVNWYYSNIQTGVSTKTITEILEQHSTPQKINFVSLDIEGSEKYVLNYWPWEKYDVDLWCVEDGAFKDLFVAKGYSQLTTSDFDIMDSNVFWGKK